MNSLYEVYRRGGSANRYRFSNPSFTHPEGVRSTVGMARDEAHGVLATVTANAEVEGDRSAPGMIGSHGPTVEIPFSERETSKDPFSEGERER